jgi:ribonuclease P protein component
MQRQYRLHQTRNFERLRQEGHVYRHPLLVVNVAPNHLAHNRYGFITSRQLGKAVVRNRTRRLMREAVRQLHPHLNSGFDMVLIARPRLAQLPFDDVYEAVQEMARRAAILVERQNPT